MIKKLVLLVLLLLILIVLTCIRPFGCESKDEEGLYTFKQDTGQFRNLTAKAKEYMKKNKINTLFFKDDDIMNSIIKEVNSRMNTNFKKSDRSLWMRYYDSESKNPYEEYHYDRQRYCRNSKQVRVVIVLYDDSDSHFCYKVRCGDKSEDLDNGAPLDGEVCIPSEVGNWSVIYANKLLHAAKVRKGERLVLMADLVDDSTRGVCGTFFSIWDYIWLQWIVHVSVGKVVHIPDFSKSKDQVQRACTH